MSKLIRRMKKLSHLALNSIILSSLFLSQLSLSEILLYQNESANSISTVQAAAPAWHHPDWNFRKEINIDHAMVETEDLSDYPFLFSVTDEAFKSPSNSGKLGKEDGTDILFTKEDGTKLSHEIEEYDPQTGKIVAWIKIPLLSHTQDTKLYIYYGNASASNQEDKQNVWKDSYKLVQHMGDQTPTTVSDSTLNNNHGTKSGALEIDGKIGKAQSFDGSDHISINDHDSLDFNNSDWTISFWVKSQAGEDGEVLSKGHSYEDSLQIRKIQENKIWSNINGSGILRSPVFAWNDNVYVYTVDRSNQRVVKSRIEDMSYAGEIVTWEGGNGQFADPIGIWGDGTRLYVANSNYHCIEVFSLEDLSYITQIGSGTPGSGDNDFYYADNLWGDGTYLYIVDTYNNRIVKRRADDYSFVAKIGSQGSGNDQFYRPWGIWGDGTYLYVADTENYRIVKRRTDDLSYVAQIGTIGSGINQFARPTSIWGDGTYLYVADSLNHRIVKRLASNLSYISHIGGTASGSGNDQFNRPTSIWGNGAFIYVNDYYNDRVVKRSASDLSYVSHFGISLYSDNYNYQGIYSDGEYLYVTDILNHRIVKRRASDSSFIASIGTAGSGNDQFANPIGIWGDSTYLYVADSGNNRIVKRRVNDLSYVAQIGTMGSGNDQFNVPKNIWGDGTYLYIADTNNHRIVKRLASNLSYVSHIGGTASGSGNDQFSSPRGIWGDGIYLYIADYYNHRIVKRRTDDLSYVSHIGGPAFGSGNDEFRYPSGIWGDGIYLYVLDSSNNRIVKRLASNLSYVSHLGGTASGSGDNQLKWPSDIGGNGAYLYITDTGNNRIVKKLASDLSHYHMFSSVYFANHSSSFNNEYNYVVITKRNSGGIVTLSDYLNASLDTQISSRTYSDVGNDKSLIAGYLLTGEIDELRISLSVSSSSLIQTEYNNQSSPSSFFSLSSEEEHMKRFSIQSEYSSQLPGESQSLTITAIGSSGGTYTSYAGDKTITLSGASSENGRIPAYTDKDGNPVSFGSSATLTFINGVSQTTITLHKAETVNLQITDGEYSSSVPLSVQVLSQGSVFLPPPKPLVTLPDIISGTLPQGIIQIAISQTPDFKDSIFQEIDYQKLKDIPQTNTTLYLKFRTKEGAVSDVLTIHPTSTLLEGDIVKTPHHHDVFIIKYQNGKRYKRLILSPSVFNSYGHLKWENIKTISQDTLDTYTTSSLVQVKGDNNIYELTPEGDTGKRRIISPSTQEIDRDGVYEINQTDRDSYAS